MPSMCPEGNPQRPASGCREGLGALCWVPLTRAGCRRAAGAAQGPLTLTDVSWGSAMSPQCHRITQNHSIPAWQGWQGPLWVTQPSPLPKQGHPEQGAQHRIQAGLEYLQRRRLHSLPGQPGPGLRHPHREEVLPHVPRGPTVGLGGSPRAGSSTGPLSSGVLGDARVPCPGAWALGRGIPSSPEPAGARSPHPAQPQRSPSSSLLGWL